MARSVGEALSNGLESGFRLALDTQQRQRDNERQDRLDRQNSEQLGLQNARVATQDARQVRSDQVAARAAQTASFKQRIATADANGQSLPAGELAAMQGAVSQNEAADSADYASMGGADITAISKKNADLAKQAEKGELDLSQVPDQQFGNIIAQQAKRPIADFVRDQKTGASLIGQAGHQVIEGLQSGDTPAVIQGLNVLQKPRLDKMIGQPSPHGGTIVGSTIADMHPAPNSTKEDPRFIPMLKVWVNDGSKRAESGDLAHPTITSEEAQGAPPGATGHYFAPATEDGSTKDDAKVMSIGLNDGMNFVGSALHMEELLNSPEAQQKLKGAYSVPGQTPDDWLRAHLGVTRAKPTLEEISIPAGGKHITRVRDAKSGAVISEKVDQADQRSRSQTLIEKAQELADQNGTDFDTEYGKLRAANKGGETKDDAIARIKDLGLPPAQERAAILSVAAGIKPGKYTGSGLGAAGGTGGTGGPSLKEREQDRKEMKDKFDRRDKAADNAEAAAKSAQAELRDHTKEGAPLAKGPALNAYNARAEELRKDVATARSLAAAARKRANDVADELDSPPKPGLADAKAKPRSAAAPKADLNKLRTSLGY